MHPHRQIGRKRKGLNELVVWCAAGVLGAATLAGCGDGGSGSSSVSVAVKESPSGIDVPPSGHGPQQHLSSRQVKAFGLRGRRACRAKTPLEVAERFKARARRAGASKHFVELVTEPNVAVERSPAYPQLVAAFYAMTLPESERAAAAADCAKELAAYSDGGRASSDRAGR